MLSATSPEMTPLPQVRLFFAHQSVGANVLEGLTELQREGRPVPEIRQTTQPGECTARSLIAHCLVGRNHAPLSKLEDFAAALATAADHVDMAMLKFCYVDIQSEPAARTLFAQYLDTVRALQRRHPQLIIGHVTVPLRSVPEGMYASLRKALGHRHAEHERNRARTWFNDELRRTFSQSAPLFDLAAVEATRPDGRPCISRIGKEAVPALAPELTHDGGHLNERGRRIAALAFADFLTRQEARCQPS